MQGNVDPTSGCRTIIEFRDVSKHFTIRNQRTRSLQETLIGAFNGQRRRQTSEEFWALQHVNFRVMAGESVALIGSNGSGKSTALKLITRIIYPTSGTIAVQGRVAALLELGAGFHPDLSGRENVYLNGSILGLKRADIHKQFEDIVAFSELERFIDVPIRNYSSGMMMRLGFSVATAFQPEVLLIDEVLAVGDQNFQERCLHRIEDLQEQGATIIMVTHDLGSVRELCQRAIWLDKGQVCASGPSEDVTSRYLEAVWGAQKDPAGVDGATDGADSGAEDGADGTHAARWGSGEVKIERAELLGADGLPTNIFHTGDRFLVRIAYHALKRVERPAFGIGIYDEEGKWLNGPNTIWSGAPIAGVEGRGVVDYVVDQLPLLAGHYELTVAIYDKHVAHPYDHWHRMTTFSVVSGDLPRQDGAIYIPCHWEHMSASGQAAPVDDGGALAVSLR